MPKKTKAKVGRPSKFDPAFIEQAQKLALLGLTNEEMAKFFGVAGSTFDKWMAENAEFSGAVKAGKVIADGTVVQSLYRRANGYEHSAVKIFMVKETVTETGLDGETVTTKTERERYVPYTERYPPDATSAIFWLKNRQPAIWRDKVDVEQKHSIDTEAMGTTPLELARGLAFVLALAQRETGTSTAAPAAPPTKH